MDWNELAAEMYFTISDGERLEYFEFRLYFNGASGCGISTSRQEVFWYRPRSFTISHLKETVQLGLQWSYRIRGSFLSFKVFSEDYEDRIFIVQMHQGLDALVEVLNEAQQ